MIVWITTVFLALMVARIIYLEVRDGRRSRVAQEITRVQIDTLKNKAIVRYQTKFGRDPTGVFPLVDAPERISKTS